MKLSAVLILTPLLIALAIATPYIPLEEISTHYGTTLYTVPQVDKMYNHTFEFIQLAAFEQPLQCEVPGSNWGGQREEESGWMYNIIETDNTLESIWVWSRYYELTGDDQYNDEIRDAWTYAYTYPAWLEGAGYYSAHNCAWALAAELQYRTTFNDSAHWNYAVQSAQYIVNTPLSFASDLNVMVTGWCCGNLYLYGEATGNEAYMDVAVERGQLIMDWVELYPETRLAIESWAMSSGTFVWGICNSTFRDDPAQGQSWLATYGPIVQVLEPSLPSWSNAWNVAYCNAQGGMYDVTGEDYYLQNHLYLTNYLLAKDTDNDGGIPASASYASNLDASWTSSYLAMMGCNKYTYAEPDAGVMIIRSPQDSTRIDQGDPIDISVMVGNWGLNDLNDVMVVLEGAYQDTAFIDIAGQGRETVEFGQWTPTIVGIDSITATVTAVGDTNWINDTDVTRFQVRAVDDLVTVSSARDDDSESAHFVDSNIQKDGLQFFIPEPGNVKIEVYNILGQKTGTIVDNYYESGTHVLAPDFRLLTGSSGIYLISMTSGSGNDVIKTMLMK